jgi:hypothetical protein
LATLLSAPILIASASAAPCPDVEVTFARGTNEPGGHAGDDQRANQPGAVSHPNRKVRDALDVQIAHHARVGDQVVRQHHQIDGVGRHGGVRQALDVLRVAAGQEPLAEEADED